MWTLFWGHLKIWLPRVKATLSRCWCRWMATLHLHFRFWLIFMSLCSVSSLVAKWVAIHLFCLEGKELWDVESEPDGEADDDVKQEVSPPLWQRKGNHHEHPAIEKQTQVENQQLQNPNIRFKQTCFTGQRSWRERCSPTDLQKTGTYFPSPAKERFLFCTCSCFYCSWENLFFYFFEWVIPFSFFFTHLLGWFGFN